MSNTSNRDPDTIAGPPVTSITGSGTVTDPETPEEKPLIRTRLTRPINRTHNHLHQHQQWQRLLCPGFNLKREQGNWDKDWDIFISIFKLQIFCSRMALGQQAYSHLQKGWH